MYFSTLNFWSILGEIQYGTDPLIEITKTDSYHKVNPQKELTASRAKPFILNSYRQL